MKLEHQVCSLDLAKRLKELEVKQDGLYVWHDKHFWLDVRAKVIETSHYKHLHSAFTVAELGKMLPKLNGRGWVSTHRNGDDKWFCEFKISSFNTENAFVENTEADARAKCLIYLLENDLIKL